MIDKYYIRIALFLLALIPVMGLAQEKVYSELEYDELKQAGALPQDAKVHHDTRFDIRPQIGQVSTGARAATGCDCWVEPDGTYTLAMGPNDDGSSAAITLPFTFNLYSETYNTVYINNNGNISFDTPWATYSPVGFPSASYKMIAPFWGDVDTRNGGQVWYKVTPTALYVNWVDVGYYRRNNDKANTFQLIITDGTDPIIGTNNNVAFCYQICSGPQEKPHVTQVITLVLALQARIAATTVVTTVMASVVTRLR